MHYNCVWRTDAVYLSMIQVNTVTHISVIRQNVFYLVRVMVISASSDLKEILSIKDICY